KHQEVRLLQSRDDAIVPALLAIVGVCSSAVPGVDEIDLAGCADVGDGIRWRFHVRELLSAGRDYGLGLVGHFPWPEIGPTDETDLHVISEGLHRGLSNQSQNAPWASLARSGKHRPLDVDSGWPDIDRSEVDLRLFGLCRMQRALARTNDQKSDNTANPGS